MCFCCGISLSPSLIGSIFCSKTKSFHLYHHHPPPTPLFLKNSACRCQDQYSSRPVFKDSNSRARKEGLWIVWGSSFYLVQFHLPNYLRQVRWKFWAVRPDLWPPNLPSTHCCYICHFKLGKWEQTATTRIHVWIYLINITLNSYRGKKKNQRTWKWFTFSWKLWVDKKKWDQT